ncbi:hypothetical protein SKAU_G00368350 [Synaphobranchus kaupii]|uniref:Uncharacterized protein n=1 Tax=Synaphobranchus kaupii TaxID=118154 RepID=A0A9Q1EFJ1_SYNKA|nr:hypothetical protein SKAU_G00368350 [Synaphobranchus kaupii]
MDEVMKTVPFQENVDSGFEQERFGAFKVERSMKLRQCAAVDRVGAASFRLRRHPHSSRPVHRQEVGDVSGCVGYICHRWPSPAESATPAVSKPLFSGDRATGAPGAENSPAQLFTMILEQ